MRARGWFFLGLLGAGCVDLTLPPELERPSVLPGGHDAAALADAANPPPATDAAVSDLPPSEAMGAVDAAGGFDSVEALDATTAATDAADAASTPDAPPSPDATAPADLAVSPPPIPDAAAIADAPPLSPDAPRPDAATPDANVPDASPPDSAVDVGAPDTGPPPVVIDDFETALPANRNRLGSETTSDNETCGRVNGELVCTYAGSGGFHDYIETLANWCEYDARAYAKLRLRMRTSVPGETVAVYLGFGTGQCREQRPHLLLGTIVTTGVMTTYDFDLPAVGRDKLILVELDPKSLNDTRFILDDLQLVP